MADVVYCPMGQSSGQLWVLRHKLEWITTEHRPHVGINMLAFNEFRKEAQDADLW